jgi:hypothetical protein
MPIRDEFDPQSSTKQLEKEWFEKSEISEDDLTRFIHMKYSDRNKKTWFIKKDLSDATIDLNDTEWTINEDKYENRPDVISYKFYNNSKYWWVIALRNEIKDPFKEFQKGRTLLIPNLNLVKKYLGLY